MAVLKLLIEVASRVYTPYLRPKISSLQDVLEQSADKPVPIPSKFPARTKKTRDVNDHQIRYGDTPMHDHLESNIPAEIMAYVNEPFPKDISPRSQTIWGQESPFRNREVIRRWIEGMFLKHGYEKYLELETTVELAEKVDEKWVLTLRKEIPSSEYNAWWQESFDALVVANGHYHVPNIPKVEGLVEFEAKYPGTVLHIVSIIVGRRIIVTR